MLNIVEDRKNEFKIKNELRNKPKIYFKELLEALFCNFYTKVPYFQKKFDI